MVSVAILSKISCSFNGKQVEMLYVRKKEYIILQGTTTKEKEGTLLCLLIPLGAWN